VEGLKKQRKGDMNKEHGEKEENIVYYSAPMRVRKKKGLPFYKVNLI